MNRTEVGDGCSWSRNEMNLQSQIPDPCNIWWVLLDFCSGASVEKGKCVVQDSERRQNGQRSERGQ